MGLEENQEEKKGTPLSKGKRALLIAGKIVLFLLSAFAVLIAFLCHHVIGVRQSITAETKAQAEKKKQYKIF